MKKVEKPYIIDRIAENRLQVPYHDANSHEYLAIHYLGVNGENPDLYGGGYVAGIFTCRRLVSAIRRRKLPIKFGT